MTETKGRLAILDDDPEIRALLQRYLSENGYQVRAAIDGAQLDKYLGRETFDAIILDLMMPGEDGLSVCRRLRAAGQETPIIILTAKGDPIDRILGLEMGADDYLAKPFLPRELLARIEAIRRRTKSTSAEISGEGIYCFGELTLDLGHMSLHRFGQPIELSVREFTLLKTFIKNAGRPLSRAQIIDLAFGRDAEVTDRAVDVQIVRLRKLIEDDPANPKWIRTVWGHGYVFTRNEAAA